MMELFQYCFLAGVIPPSWKKARLVLIPKEGKDCKLPSAYRPLSMLNANYKLLATILANRLTEIIEICVHKDQSGFIHGRYLKTNVRKVLNIVNKAQTENIQWVLLFLDTEKAFDWIEKEHMFSIAKKFNLGSFFYTWMDLLYQH